MKVRISEREKKEERGGGKIREERDKRKKRENKPKPSPFKRPKRKKIFHKRTKIGASSPSLTSFAVKPTRSTPKTTTKRKGSENSEIVGKSEKKWKREKKGTKRREKFEKSF